MAEDPNPTYPGERRSEPRKTVDQFHSVEIDLGRPLPIYHFRLRDVSSKGARILVKANSEILRHLKVGQELKMKYYFKDISKPTEVLRTEIKYITKADQEPYSGHYLIGVFVLEKF